jgi:alkylated DNA nucleotide flippase Atl1
VDPEEYAELVLECVEQVPRGRVTTYGAIAEAVGAVLGGGGPRQVGSVMALQGGGVPWWRVVRGDGSLPPSHDDARQSYLEEGTPLRPSGRVDLTRALFRPVLGPAGRAPASHAREGPSTNPSTSGRIGP